MQGGVSLEIGLANLRFFCSKSLFHPAFSREHLLLKGCAIPTSEAGGEFKQPFKEKRALPPSEYRTPRWIRFKSARSAPACNLDVLSVHAPRRVEDGRGGGCDDDDHREGGGGGGGGAIRQYSFFLCIGETGLEWSVQSVQGKEGTKTLEIIQVKLYATPPATTTSLARSLATGPGTT